MHSTSLHNSNCKYLFAIPNERELTNVQPGQFDHGDSLSTLYPAVTEWALVADICEMSPLDSYKQKR